MQIIRVCIFVLAIFRVVANGEEVKIQTDTGVPIFKDNSQSPLSIQRPSSETANAANDRSLIKASQINIHPFNPTSPQRVQKWIIAKSMKSVTVTDALPIDKKKRKKISLPRLNEETTKINAQQKVEIEPSPLFDELKQFLQTSSDKSDGKNDAKGLCELLETEDQKANAPMCVKKFLDNFDQELLSCSDDLTNDIAFDHIRYPVDHITLIAGCPLEIANRIKLLKALGDNEMFWGMLQGRCFIKRNAQGQAAVVYLRRRVTESFQSYFSGKVPSESNPFDQVFNNVNELFKAIEDDNDSFMYNKKEDFHIAKNDASINTATEPVKDSGIKFSPRHLLPSKMQSFSLILVWRLMIAYQTAYKINKLLASCVGFAGPLADILYFEDPLNVLISPSKVGLCQIRGCQIVWQGYRSVWNDQIQELIKPSTADTYEPCKNSINLYDHQKVNDEMLKNLNLPICSASAMMDIRYAPLTLVSQIFLYFYEDIAMKLDFEVLGLELGSDF